MHDDSDSWQKSRLLTLFLNYLVFNFDNFTMKPSKSTVKLSKRQYKRVSRTKSAGNKRCKLALKRDSVSGSKRSSSSVRAKAQKRPHSEEKTLINDKKRRLNRENPWNKIWKVIDERTRQNGHRFDKADTRGRFF